MTKTNLIKSFAFKNAILYLIIFLLGLGTMGYLMLNNSSNRIVETAKNQLSHNGDLVRIQISDFINDLISSSEYLTYSPVLSNYLSHQTQSNYDLLSENYLSLLKSNSDYSQIRFIEISEGKEIIRVERKEAKAIIVKEASLQNKKNRPYFLETVNLDSNDIYFSPIDLNKEYGKISSPRMPTLRLARPVYHQGIKKGVIVINTDLTKLFSRLKNTVGNDYLLRMSNEAGYYIMHEELDSTFLFEFKEYKPQLNVSNINESNKIISSPEFIISNHRFKADKMGYDFIYQVLTETELLMSSYYDWRRKSILLILITGLIFTTVAFFILNRQAQTLRKFTDNMKSFSENRKLTTLPINRDDEIGDLAKGFKEMSTIINSQINSINKERIKAQKAVKDKSDFLENMSHELRNPLHSIMGLSTMLENNNPNSNQLDILNSLKFNTSNLLGLVNNILDYQNMIKGNIELNYSWTDVPQLINEVVMGNKYSAVEKSISLVTEFDEQLYQYDFKTDKLRLSQILGNIISNAIKFTPSHGSVTVAAKMIPKENKSILRLSIQDTGIGMTAEEMDKIKERYFTKKGIQNLSSNFGLGLTIVSELLSLFDSKIEIKSKKDFGSTFYFELLTEARNTQTDQNVKAQLDLEGLHIRVIEDDIQIVNLYKHLLKETGANISYLPNLESTTNTNDQSDLIISDFRLSDKTLLDEKKKLKQLMKDEACLIIASASSLDMKILKKEFDNLWIIKKPFTMLELRDLIFTALTIVRYGIPQTVEIKKDYDFVKRKYTNALNILQSEWQNTNKNMHVALSNNDVIMMDEILHKFITTLRRLKLDDLGNWIMEIKNNIPYENAQKEKIAKNLDEVMNCYHKLLIKDL